MAEKFFIIYKTTNLINGKFYIGKHETTILNDGYLGSGKSISASIRKHGINNFKREILEFASDRISLNKREREIVNDDFLIKNSELCYNIIRGGTGGDARNFSRNISPTDLAIKAAITLKSRPETLRNRNKQISVRMLQRYKDKPETFIGGVGNKGKRKETDVGIQRQIAARKIVTDEKNKIRLTKILNCVNAGLKRQEILQTLTEYSSSTIDRVLRQIRYERDTNENTNIN